MKKTIFKKILCIINYMNQQVNHMDLTAIIKQQLAEEEIFLSLEELQYIIYYIEETEILYKDEAGYDLIPCACVFAKADHHSITEALAFIECLLKKQKHHQIFHTLMDMQPDIDITNYIEPFTFDLMQQTIIFIKDKQTYHLNPVLLDDVKHIMTEYEQGPLIISSTLSAIYANNIIHHEDESIRYRNEDKEIVAYDNLDQILRIIPRIGIPENRDITKPVQVFYKDTLMHEFHHRCPICGIDIPHMLIASHIKPFRDCAHIYEALDHHNGLLLCRNHDYLFDQGYISFEDDGTIMISSFLKDKEQLQDAYHIQPGWKLPTEYLRMNRMLFLKYHREHLWQDHQ